MMSEPTLDANVCCHHKNLKSKTVYSIWFVRDEGIHPKNVGGVHKFKNILSLNDRSYSW